jgi:uncharacterized protein YunC (DUF1805 family)
MPLLKYAIDRNAAKGKYYLVAGNRVHLADVGTDSVAEKLFNAKVKGVSLLEPMVTAPVSEAAVVAEEPSVTAETPVSTARKK